MVNGKLKMTANRGIGRLWRRLGTNGFSNEFCSNGFSSNGFSSSGFCSNGRFQSRWRTAMANEATAMPRKRGRRKSGTSRAPGATKATNTHRPSSREAVSLLEERRRAIREDRIPLRAFIKKAGRSSRRKSERNVLYSDLTNEETSSSEAEEIAKKWAENKTYFIETLGCQMNFADSEIVASVLEGAGYSRINSLEEADVAFVNTCAIRENAEDKAIQRLQVIRKKGPKNQQIGVLGCMAERLKERLLEDGLVNIVAGPDSYRDLPYLLGVAAGQGAMNVQLSVDETYADIAPVRLGESWQAYISITRGCNNMCSYCIVPFTRGRERSRSIKSILNEVEQVAKEGKAKEITLLGQNVNSYFDKSTPSTFSTLPSSTTSYKLAAGFNDLYQARHGDGIRFGQLLDQVAQVDPTIRIRFTSPHPKDFTDDVLHVIAKHDNICKGLHLPAQSGSDAVLKSMRRGYTRQAYLDLVNRAKDIVGPDLELSSDFISGFCGETEKDHQDTLRLMEEVGFVQAFMFAYSVRERTHAFHKLKDDVPAETKLERLREVVETFGRKAKELAADQIGKEHVVLIEGASRRDESIMQGKTLGLRRCMIQNSSMYKDRLNVGDYVKVRITEASQATLKGDFIL